MLSNVPCENVVDLGMPWNRLFHAVLWVDVDVMSYGNRFFLIVIRDILHDHHLVGILEIFLKFLQCSSLCHDFRVLFQLSEPKLAAFPVDHFHCAFHMPSAFGSMPLCCNDTRFSAPTIDYAGQPILVLPLRTTGVILSGFRQLVKVVRTLP